MPGERPSGTVTFLFTDIESSTRLWEERPDEMRKALAEHDEILRSAIVANDGVVFATGGDGVAAAFHRAVDGVAAAVAAQDRLAAHPFLRVRMGVHTGEAQERDGDYFGPAVNRAARIMSAGHGGQIVLSAVTAALTESVDALDLGEHRLAGLSAPMHVYQLGDSPFPPLRSIDTVATNLPAERTGFVGRHRELAAVERAIASSRVVTLAGVGGVGKTRLAIQTAAQLLGEYRDGVWFVDLAPLIDAALIATQVVSSIEPSSRLSEDSVAAVCRLLAKRRALLVLDNCEHVLDGVAALVDRVVDAAPRVAILATSREPLGVRGEYVFRVPSLSIDTTDGTLGEAMQLFIERAEHVRGGFKFDDGARPAVAQICRRLDGIPLAIELAAARVNVLPVDQIAARLDERFRLLGRGGRTAVARQQTLQGAIDWSYELLSPAERALFDALAVFAGDFDLVAASAVGELDEFEALDTIQLLVDKSMVESDADRGRYRLLETLRQYGWDQLVRHDLLVPARRRHADHCASLVRAQTAALRTPGQQTTALDVLDADYDNLRAALAYLIESRDAPAATRMLLPLVTLFNIRHPREGFAWFKALLEIVDGVAPQTRAVLLANASFAAMNVGDLRSQLEYARAAIECGGDQTPTVAYNQLAMWHWANGDVAGTIEVSRRAIAAASGDPTMTLLAQIALVTPLGVSGDEAEVRAIVPPLLDLADRIANPTLISVTYASAGNALVSLGYRGEALPLYHRAVRSADAGGPQVAVATRCWTALVIDDTESLLELMGAALPIARDHLAGYQRVLALVPAAKAVHRLGETALGAQLIGTYLHQLELVGVRGDPELLRVVHRELLPSFEAAIGPSVLATAIEEGRRITPDDALQFAIDALGKTGSTT